MTTWNPSSCHVAYLLGNTTITRSAVDSSSGNTHFAPSVSNKSLSVVSLQSSLFCKLVYEANTVDSCVLCLFTVPYLIFNNFPCRFRTRPICSSNPWRSSERSKSESQKWALLVFFFCWLCLNSWIRHRAKLWANSILSCLHKPAAGPEVASLVIFSLHCHFLWNGDDQSSWAQWNVAVCCCIWYLAPVLWLHHRPTDQ